jgi:hypothetical protein
MFKMNRRHRTADQEGHSRIWHSEPSLWDCTTMTTNWRRVVGAALLFAAGTVHSGAVELKVSREALERTLKQQLFGGPNGRYYLKGGVQTACYVYGDDPHLTFAADRIVIRLKTHARLGKAMGGSCLGIALSPVAEVSVAPQGEGETIGFRDARVERVSDREELNFVLTPFLSRQIPSGMKVNAADLLRKALESSTTTSGYKLTLDKLKIHSIQIAGDDLVVDADGDLSVK